MEITLGPGVHRQLCDHARAGYPYEVVGILAGIRATGVVEEAISLVNERADSPKNRYQVSSMALFRAEQAVEQSGREIVGYYHSHPDHPARYSDFDRDHALPNMCYLILSVQGAPSPEVIDTLAWRLTEDREAMTPDPLFISGELMSVSIAIPTALRAYTDGKPTVQVNGSTAGEAIDALTQSYPKLAQHLKTTEGKLRSFVNVYLNEDDIRHLNREATPLKEGDLLTIVPSIAGGTSNT